MAATGSPILSGLILAMCAKPKTMGARMMKPTSKKIGMPRMKEAAVTAAMTRWRPRILVKRSARVSAPPAASMARPSMAPRPTMMATVPRVLPMPSIMVWTTSPTGMRAARASTMETRIMDTKALILARMTRTSRTAIAPAARRRRTVADMGALSPSRGRRR